MRKEKKDNVLSLRRDVRKLVEKSRWKEKMKKSRKRIQHLLQQITSSGSKNLPPNWKSRVIQA